MGKLPGLNVLEIEEGRRRIRERDPLGYDQGMLIARGMLKATMDERRIGQPIEAVRQIIMAEQASGRCTEAELETASTYLFFAAVDHFEQDAMAAVLRDKAKTDAAPARRAAAERSLKQSETALAWLGGGCIILLFFGDMAAAVGFVGLIACGLALYVVEWAQGKAKQ